MTNILFHSSFLFQEPGESLAVHSLPAKLAEFVFRSRNLLAKHAVPHGPHRPESHMKSRCKKKWPVDQREREVTFEQISHLLPSGFKPFEKHLVNLDHFPKYG